MGCWWMLLCELDGRVLGGMGGMQFGMLLCELDGWVLGGMQVGVLVGAALRA